MSRLGLSVAPARSTEDPEAQRDQIRRYFHATFDKTEQLFALFTDPAAYYIKHEPLRHPPIFYYGHTACAPSCPPPVAVTVPGLRPDDDGQSLTSRGLSRFLREQADPGADDQ